MSTDGPAEAARAAASPDEVLARFSPATRTWFPEASSPGRHRRRRVLAAIPAASHARGRAHRLGQDAGGLPRGRSTALAAQRRPGTGARCRVLYVSPLKALAVDIERNLRSPLAGIRRRARRGAAARRRGRSTHGRHPRRRARGAFARAARHPHHRPRSRCSSCSPRRAREALRDVETVIVDEISPRLASSAAPTWPCRSSGSMRSGPGPAALAARRPARRRSGRPRRSRASSAAAATGHDAPCDTGSGSRGPSRSGVDLGPPRRAGDREDAADPGPPRRGRPALDLAARRGARRRPRPGAPVHHRVRQLPAPCRAPPPAALERRPRARRLRSQAITARCPQGARRRRGAAEARPAPGRRRHVVPRARHRHGRSRPRRAGRVAAVGRQRACSASAGGSPCRRRLAAA